MRQESESLPQVELKIVDFSLYSSEKRCMAKDLEEEVLVRQRPYLEWCKDYKSSTLEHRAKVLGTAHNKMRFAFQICSTEPIFQCVQVRIELVLKESTYPVFNHSFIGINQSNHFLFDGQSDLFYFNSIPTNLLSKEDPTIQLHLALANGQEIIYQSDPLRIRNNRDSPDKPLDGIKLNDSTRKLPFISDSIAQKLASLGINTVYDYLQEFTFEAKAREILKRAQVPPKATLIPETAYRNRYFVLEVLKKEILSNPLKFTLISSECKQDLLSQEARTSTSPEAPLISPDPFWFSLSSPETPLTEEQVLILPSVNHAEREQQQKEEWSNLLQVEETFLPKHSQSLVGNPQNFFSSSPDQRPETDCERPTKKICPGL